MPALSNQRHELYCAQRARGMVPAKAAIAAGFAAGPSIYTNLEKDPEIIQRISELLEEYRLHKEQRRVAALEAARMVGKTVGYTRAWVLEQLAEVAAQARADGEYGEANNALKLIGQELDMFKGHSKGDEDDDAPQSLDMDAAERLLNRADPDMLDVTPAPKPVDVDAALKLIGKSKPVDPDKRKLHLDSEVGVALTPEADPDE